MIIGLCILAASGVAAWASVGVLTLTAAMVIRGVGVSTWQLARSSFMSGWVPKTSNGKANSWMGGVMRFANVVGPALGGIIVTRWGMRLVFIAAAVAAVPAALVILSVMPSVTPPKKKPRGGCGSGTYETLQEHSYTFLTAGFFCFTTIVVRTSRNLIMPLQGHHLGLSVAEVSYLSSMSYTVELFFFWTSGVIMDRYGRKFSAVPSSLLMGLSMMAIPLSQNYSELLIVSIIFGLGSTIGSGIVLTLTTDFAPETRKNEFLAIFRSVTKLGPLLGPVATGGLAQISLGVAGLSQGGVAILGGLWAAALMKETLALEAEKGITEAPIQDGDKTIHAARLINDMELQTLAPSGPMATMSCHCTVRGPHGGGPAPGVPTRTHPDPETPPH